MHKLFTLLLIAYTTLTFAQIQLGVDLSKKIRPVTHCASGSLYGVTETLPTDIENLVAPLKPHVFANPAQSGPGKQQPIGYALEVSRRLQNTTGKVQVRLPDVLPGWPYRWPGLQSFLSTCTQVINAKKASGRTNYDGYEIWNEPYGTWNNSNGNFFSSCWKPTFDLIRNLDPGERIIGPSLAYYNNNRMRDFLTYCKANNCIPDVVCWHQWGAGGFVSAYNQYRALEKELGISPRPISINEYSSKTSDPNEGCPGYSVPFISKFERHGIESACISWWFTNLPGRLGSLLTANNQKGGGWHLYKWYGDMSGSMVQVTPPNDYSEDIDGFACIDDQKNYASICIGGNNTGIVNVKIAGIPAKYGSKVKVKLEYVTWVNKDTPVPGTNLISETEYTVSNNSITVPVNVTSKLYAYRVYVTPVQIVGPPSVKITSPEDGDIFISPATIAIKATASDADGSVSKVEFFANGKLLFSDNTAPYSYEWANTQQGKHVIRAVATDNEGNTNYDEITVYGNLPQGPFGGTLHPIPGKIELENYDIGGNGFAYFDDTPGSEVTPLVNFRTNEDVDIENCTDTGGGYNLGYTLAGEWLEYSVNVAKAGIYKLNLRVACNGEGRSIALTIDDLPLASNITIPNTEGWQNWQTITVDDLEMTPGEHIIRLTIGSTDYVNLNYMTFEEVIQVLPPKITLNAPINQITVELGEVVPLSATASDPDGNIVGVSFYAGDNLLTTVNTSPFTYQWTPTEAGTYLISAEAFDTDNLSTKTNAVAVVVLGFQEPFNSSPHTIPGKIEAEEYDLGGEGVGFHEANTSGNQGGATFRDDEVDIEATEDVDGGYNLAYTLQSEWLAYTVNVVSTGNYELDIRVAKDGDGGLFHIEMDGEDITGPITVPNTSGWQSWETITLDNVNLSVGQHNMQVVFDSDYLNLNYLAFKGVVTSLQYTESNSLYIYPNPFNNEGIIVDSDAGFQYTITDIRGVVMEVGTKNAHGKIGSDLAKGIYFLRVESESGITTQKIVKQ